MARAKNKHKIRNAGLDIIFAKHAFLFCFYINIFLKIKNGQQFNLIFQSKIHVNHAEN
jgi:hypothetical protein